MSFYEKYLYESKEYSLIGDLIPKEKTTLLHGRSGSGKTYSIIKFFNEHNIEPILLDFDNNDSYSDMNIYHANGYKFVNIFWNGSESHSWNNVVNHDRSSVLKEIQKQTIIIDTYTKANKYIEYITHGSFNVEMLCEALNNIGCTVIVVAHTEYFSSKAPEPMCTPEFANHVACRLHLVNKPMQKKHDIILQIEKLRNSNVTSIENWMRKNEM